MIGNVMYVHTSFPNIVYALDLAKEGAPQIWKYVPQQSPDAIPIACCDLVNRGVAYSPSGKIYIEALQGDLIALDAKITFDGGRAGIGRREAAVIGRGVGAINRNGRRARQQTMRRRRGSGPKKCSRT